MTHEKDMKTKAADHILQDPEILESYRRLLVNPITRYEFQRIFLIDSLTGDTVYLQISHEDTCVFRLYDDEMHSLVEQYCAEQDPRSIQEQLELNRVCQELDLAPCYSVFFIVTMPSGGKMHYKASFYYADGKNRIICGVFQDQGDAITREARRLARLQKSLEETRKNLDASNSFLVLLSSNDRSPLHSIMAAAEKTTLQTSEISALEGYLNRISMSGTYMRETINDIRDLIRVSWEPIRLNPVSVDLPHLASVIEKLMIPRFNAKNLRFTCRTDKLSSKPVMADEMALRQILLKLLEDTNRYTLPGGRVCLRITDARSKGDRAVLDFSMISRGIDADPQRITILSKPFSEILDDLRKDISSVDIDLVIMKAYLEAMDGEVFYKTEDQIATKITFTITLPRADKTTAAGSEDLFSGNNNTNDDTSGEQEKKSKNDSRDRSSTISHNIDRSEA